MVLNNKKYQTTLLHVGIWAFLFVFPLIMNDNATLATTVRRKWTPLTLSAIIFYLNYFYLIPQLYFPKKQTLFVLANLLLIMATLVATIFIFNWLKHEPPPHLKRPHEFKWSLQKLLRYRHNIGFFLAIGAAVAIRITQKWREEEEIRKLAENEHLKSEIASLKYQLQPHFFFNTLNNIYSLIDTQPRQAKTTIHKLAKLMRYMLYKTNETNIELSKEIEFIQAYVDVMRTRYGNHLTITTQFPESNHPVLVPPLLFISLVENAFKHGVDASLPSFIDLALVLNKDELVLTIKNSYFPKDASDESGSGIGIDNLKKRLLHLYPHANYGFTQEKKNDIYFTQLTIPINHE